MPQKQIFNSTSLNTRSYRNNEIKFICSCLVFLVRFFYQTQQYYPNYTDNPSMSNRQEIFSTSFFLYNSAKGFCLHKAKKHNISSTFKFKSKVNQPKNSKQGTLPLFREDLATQESSTKQKINEPRKFRSVQLNSAQGLDEGGTSRYERAKFNSVTIEPAFPQIDKRKVKMVTKSYRNIDECKNQYNEDPVSSNRIFYQNTTKTLQNNDQRLAKVNEEIQDMIAKEVMKTENQAILRQGQIHFDQNQVKFGIQNRKRFNNTTRKRKKTKQHIFEHIDRSPEQQSPELKTFSPMKATKIKFQTFYPKQKRNSNDIVSFPAFTRNRHLRKISQKETTNGVKGWENENISESQQFCTKDEQTPKRYSEKIQMSNMSINA